MRPSTACVECRRRRRKCIVEPPEISCQGCLSRNAHCSLQPPQPTPGASASSIGASPFDFFAGLISAVEIPTGPLRQRLISFYFQYIHDPSHALFHRPTFNEQLSLDLVPQVWLLAIIGLSARFSTDPYFDGTDPRTRGRVYARESERLLDLHDVSLVTVRASILLGAFYGTEGDAVRENLYYSTACRIGLLLDIPNMPVADALDKEMNVRLWWTLEMVDMWSSSGTQLPRAFVSRTDVPYPIEETALLRMRRSSEPSERPIENVGSIMAQMLKLNAILAEVAQVIRTVASQAQTNFRLDATVSTITKKLELWVAQLPPQLLDTPQNLANHATLGLGGMFVALHVGYYHYGQLLYYQYLHQSDAGEDLHASFCADMCRAHSISLCDIVYRAEETAGAEVYYTMIGHVLVIASTVQLHILLFSTDEAQIRASKNRLEKNFTILTKLQRLWPAIDYSFGRFTEFHKACEESKGSDAFRLDKWMLQFLLEFTRPISGQREETPPDIKDWSMQELGLNPASSVGMLHVRTLSMSTNLTT